MPVSERSTKAPRAGRFLISFSRGEKVRSIALRPSVVYAGMGLAPLVIALSLAPPLYWCYGGDLIAGLVTRQAQMQYAYEDRIAALQAQADAARQRNLQDRQKLEERVAELAARQSQTETRAATLAQLVQTPAAPRTAAIEDKRGTGKATTVVASTRNPLLAPRPPKPLPFGATAFAPVDQGFDVTEPTNPRGIAKPHPEADRDPSDPAQRVDAAPKGLQSMTMQLEDLQEGLARSERQQTAAILQLGANAADDAQRLRAALQSAGLTASRFAPATPGQKSGMGGPFIPLDGDPNGSPFQRAVAHVEDSLGETANLRGVMSRVPFGKPLAGDLEVTSPFGYRIDPFFGRPALHPGVDLREAIGSPVRATAAGRVVNASWSGGYGNMVEIDHGNGLVTRYGHLSAILVSEGEKVDGGALLGRVGSTGRSTGAHLHYEVRVDGEPVDPTRFLNAGAQLSFAAAN